MTDRRKRLLANIILFIASLVWGSSFFVVKNTVEGMPPAYLLAMRFTIGAILLTAIFHKRLRGLTGRNICRGMIIGGVMFLASYAQTIGITDTTPGKNAFLTAVYCVIVPFLFWAVAKKRPLIKSFFCAVLCFAGVGIVSLSEGFTIEFGDLMTLLSGFLFACHIVSITLLGRETDPIALTILQFGTMAALCWIAGLCFETFPTHVSRDTRFGIAYLALLPTSIGFLFQTIGQRHAPPESASIILSLESVFGVVFSVVFYGEQLTPRLLVGFVVIFAAIVISETNCIAWIRRKANPA